MFLYLIIKLLHLEKFDQGSFAKIGQQYGFRVVGQAQPLGILNKALKYNQFFRQVNPMSYNEESNTDLPISDKND